MAGSSNSFAAGAGRRLSSQKDRTFMPSEIRTNTEPDSSSDTDTDIFLPPILKKQQSQTTHHDSHRINDLTSDHSLLSSSSGNSEDQRVSTTTSGQLNQHQQAIDTRTVSSWASAFGSSSQVPEGKQCRPFDKHGVASVASYSPHKPFGQRRSHQPNYSTFRKSIRGRSDGRLRLVDADGDVIMRDVT
ncbi:hypothetical protein ASPBRDRAFT_136889 [Aspergillus brasiliensis CBS 101740]|uniref:Uncharacterized protein n=1 Tax=Aspergillus brasiliensis (strain CBS 101740 / IMI 381727 / IBT 21946) TaxID=767769 RepID=A0A1L9U5K4_ASPBC|nr:hypothetical protein ASPBRDRAFT_136889 [Aspergillus brasiliensis CBS 101740]